MHQLNTINKQCVAFLNVIDEIIIIYAHTVLSTNSSFNCEGEFLSFDQIQGLRQVPTSYLRALKKEREILFNNKFDKKESMRTTT